MNHNVNLHVGVRPIFLSIKEASGVMLELGCSFRMAVHQVKTYKFRDEFLKELK